MKPKKMMSVLLAGVLAAGMFSGCSKEIIEHQIITEVIHTGGSTGGSQQEITVIEADPEVQSLEGLLAEHGISLDIQFVDTGVLNFWWGPLDPDFDYKTNGEDYATMTVERLRSWLEEVSQSSGKLLCIYRYWGDKPEDFSLETYLQYWFENIKMLHEAFSQLNDDDWKELKDYTKLSLMASSEPQNNKYFLEMCVQVQ